MVNKSAVLLDFLLVAILTVELSFKAKQYVTLLVSGRAATCIEVGPPVLTVKPQHKNTQVFFGANIDGQVQFH